MLAGLILGAIAVLCLGAALKHENQTGRFRLEVGEGFTAYVIDTVTGQVWERNVTGSKDEFYLPKAEKRTF